MNNYTKNAVFLLLLFLGVLCKSMAVSEKFNVENYLLEAKECLNTEGSNSFERMNVPDDLRKSLEKIEARDYVSHTFLDPKELSIDFRKSQNDGSFSISLHFDLSKDKGCGRISIYEILN